ncbi:Polygalacturonate 4-alpha-galacturonosyltransferase [Camellia lanceoleosa]|uniref:Polygalacturonate 4-alpha-galacturonosyltransferase n=1 Tax=Camellia lanceoleosa TaxID=1840588 RepID=A0ACC0IQW8_9ERIC|nr:Polygalacturonate 4-alpha-galacturonosyltransferase [Camellia lanceoleosa]
MKVKEVAPEGRRRDAVLSFAFVYPDKHGRFVVKEVGRTYSYPNGRRPDSGGKALGELSFQVQKHPLATYLHCYVLNFITNLCPTYLQIGDYLDVAILLLVLVKKGNKVLFTLLLGFGEAMAVKRGLSGTGNRGGSGSRSWMVILVFFSLLAPLIFFVGRGGLYTSTLIGQNDTLTGPHKENIEWRERLALQVIKSLFSKEVIEVITANTDDLVPLSLDFLRKNNLSSSWKIVGVETVVDNNATFVEQNQIVPNIKQATPRGKQDDSTDDRSQFVDSPAKLPRRVNIINTLRAFMVF